MRGHGASLPRLSTSDKTRPALRSSVVRPRRAEQNAVP
ncbi:hypothetical protein C791_6996 [Amycolatopsis azurea DSM 43854]|uniref:Uncharacterized protein n=1 Tax=Amycolatopsis azurea DSM 43854 TaxID=1238180 RepID=M2PWL3_9PSEU|nr:hypothetical protein C791_6996 [Amycolatopsis azurea DSM 43854]